MALLTDEMVACPAVGKCRSESGARQDLAASGPKNTRMRSLVIVLGALACLGLCPACGGSDSGAGSTAGQSSSVTTVTSTATAPATSSAPSGPTASASASSTSAQPPASAGAPPCRAAGLTLAFLGQQGATGHGELGFALRNTGTGSCSTFGYPGIQFLDDHGAALPTVPTHATSDIFGSSPLHGLVVGPGHSVSFRLTVSHGGGSSAGCTTADALGVIAPNDTVALRVAIPGGAAECGTAIVSPVRPGDSAYP